MRYNGKIANFLILSNNYTVFSKFIRYLLFKAVLSAILLGFVFLL